MEAGQGAAGPVMIAVQLMNQAVKAQKDGWCQQRGGEMRKTGGGGGGEELLSSSSSSSCFFSRSEALALAFIPYPDSVNGLSGEFSRSRLLQLVSKQSSSSAPSPPSASVSLLKPQQPQETRTACWAGSPGPRKRDWCWFRVCSAQTSAR